MSFACRSVVLFMVINAALCCSQERKEALVQALTSPCDLSGYLYISYSDIDVQCGRPQPYESVEQQPAVSFSNAGQDETYTLLMMTADAPGTNLNGLRFFLNWAVTGIRGNELMYDFSPPTDLVYKYYVQEPILNSELRYKFILLSEDNGEPSLETVNSRMGFDLALFLETNNMCKSLVATSEIIVLSV